MVNAEVGQPLVLRVLFSRRDGSRRQVHANHTARGPLSQGNAQPSLSATDVENISSSARKSLLDFRHDPVQVLARVLRFVRVPYHIIPRHCRDDGFGMRAYSALKDSRKHRTQASIL